MLLSGPILFIWDSNQAKKSSIQWCIKFQQTARECRIFLRPKGLLIPRPDLPDHPQSTLPFSSKKRPSRSIQIECPKIRQLPPNGECKVVGHYYWISDCTLHRAKRVQCILFQRLIQGRSAAKAGTPNRNHKHRDSGAKKMN